MKKSKTIKGLSIGYLVFMLFILYIPILIITIQSFNSNVGSTNFTGFTLKWYSEMLQDDELMRAIFYTFAISILATILAVIGGTFTAIGINSLNKRRRRNLILMNNIPVLNADIVTGVSLFFIFKLIGYMIGLEFILGFWTLLIAHVLFCMPYVILCVLPKLSHIDNNLYDAALDLGCKKNTALMKVIIPSIKTGILTGAILAFVMSFDDFVISYLVAGGEVRNFSMWFELRQRSVKSGVWGKAYAYNTIISFIAIIGLVVYCIIKMKKIKVEGRLKYEKVD